MNFIRYAVGLGFLWAVVAEAQTSSFTYQGQLASGGSAVSGSFDLRFTLYNGATNVVAGPVTNAPVGVTNGLFVTTINFGSVVFDGSTRLLGIGVRPEGNTNAYAALLPYQVFTSTPYAIQALNASNAMTLTAALSATNLTGIIPDDDLPANVALLSTNAVFDGSVTASNFYGGGAGLTGIPATGLTGTLPDATLSANVPLFNKADNFSNSVTAVLFTGSGHGLTNVPGAFFWETVNGTVSASSNEGYIVTNGVAPVTITLPASPSVGDTFRVAGVGAGGWTIAQNAGQQILAGNLSDTSGLNWTPQAGSGIHEWTGLASSADGTKLAATTGAGYIFISTNSGSTWTQEASTETWSGVASSTDGSHLVATVGVAGGTSGSIWVSVNSGVTWTEEEALSSPCLACACSANGEIMVVAASGSAGGIYVSSNAGASWTETETSAEYWTGVACSANGVDMAACCNPSGGGYIYTSTSSGTSWTEQTESGLHNWSSIASAADGVRLVATVTDDGGIFGSANGGVTWFEENPNVSEYWSGVTSSSDGSHLAAVYDSPTYNTPGYIYTSVDSGSTWVQRYGATNAPWTAITCSADGSKLAAAAYNGYIYTSGKGATTAGTAGYLLGSYQSTLELQYVGNGLFIPLSHEGIITAF